ncbi:MAG TPA: hypothetical protein DIT40_06730 [Alphaproteobacteria bacterium]|nr:hypothetical protein [Alphaproteobacteria bacterium]
MKIYIYLIFNDFSFDYPIIIRMRGSFFQAVAIHAVQKLPLAVARPNNAYCPKRAKQQQFKEE